MSKASDILKKIHNGESKETIEPNDIESVDPSKDLDRYKSDILAQQLGELKENQGLRKTYSNRIFCLICIWLSFVILSLIFNGFKICYFNLSDKVLITFITSTTVSVIGLFVIVAKWMFPTVNHSSKKY